MDKRTRLEKLEKLYSSPEAMDKFSTRESCIDWGSRVAPLLKYNSILYAEFAAKSSMLPYELSSVTFIPLIDRLLQIVKMAIDELRIDIEAGQYEDSEIERISFIDQQRMEELRALKSSDFDLKRLILILDELNHSHKNKCFIASIALVRTLIDHVPPIFKCNNFSEVANSYGGAQSFKDSMRNLDKGSRYIADLHLHCQIRKKEVLPNKTQVSFAAEVDLLLSEIVRILK